jgi:hypothetical protein
MNSCEEKETKTRRSRGARKNATNREVTPCFVIGTDCSGPYAPAVSSDCGINSAVVRAWSSRPVGSGAPWSIASSVRLVCCDDCGEDDES